MKSAIFAASLAAFALSCAASAADYRAEAEQIALEIVSIHPRGPDIALSPAFIEARTELIAKAADTDLPHYAIALGRMFHAANDGHTAVLTIYSDAPEFAHRYPLKLKRFEDGLYVVAAKGEAETLLGARVTSIGGRKIDPLLRDFVASFAAGNRAWPAHWTAASMSIPGVLAGLDAAADLGAPVKFEGWKRGRRVTATLTAAADGHEGLTDIGKTAAPLAAVGGAPLNRIAEIADGKALALIIGGMEDEEKKSFEDFTRDASAALASTKAERVVIDLRENGGGNNMLTEPLRRTLVKSRFNRAGGIYILTSPATFSAAQNFATRLERETDALFAGEPTGGSPNHFGDAKFAKGVQSGLPYIISTLRWQDSPPFDNRAWILPDLPAPPTFDDYLAGRDGALEAALAHKAEATADDWRGRVVQPWGRESQTGDWKFFFEG